MGDASILTPPLGEPLTLFQATKAPHQQQSNCNVTMTAGGDSLPVWNINGPFGFANYTDPKLQALFQEVEEMAKAFSTEFTGKLTELLESSIKKWEELMTKKGRIMSYLHLSFDVDQKNTELHKFKTSMEAKMSK